MEAGPKSRALAWRVNAISGQQEYLKRSQMQIGESGEEQCNADARMALLLVFFSLLLDVTDFLR